VQGKYHGNNRVHYRWGIHAEKGDRNTPCTEWGAAALKEVQDLKTVLEESIDRLITKESMGDFFARGVELFHTKKISASQITPEKTPGVEQVSMIATLSEESQEATSTTIATAPAIIMTPPTTISAAPIIQETAEKDIAVEQEVLPLTKEAKESDEMIFDLSEIDTNAAILPNWENYKPDCVFRPDVKKDRWHFGETGVVASRQ
jgi:hypothetical protein